MGDELNWKFWERSQPEEHRYTMDDYAAWMNVFTYQGNAYGFGLGGGLKQTLVGEAEPEARDFEGNSRYNFGEDAIVFAAMAVRQNVFSSIRFQWQQITKGRPGDLFGNPALGILENPWPSGTTQDLLSQAIQDADLAGNYYSIPDTPLPLIGSNEQGKELVRLRPDWVQILLEPRIMPQRRLRDANGNDVGPAHVGYRKVGYLYYEGGVHSGVEPVVFGREEVAHFAPLPDPLATYRGMSWLTPLAREIAADKQMTKHKQKFLENGATPSMIIHYPVETTIAQARKFRKALEEEHQGVQNAYKPLHVGGGADATVVGSNFNEIDFKAVQGAGETRIASAAGVPAVVLGLSEGMQGSSLNAGNYGQARRRLADITAHPLWANVSGSLELLCDPKPTDPVGRPLDKGSYRLWYDARDVPFLREDAKDAALITQIQMTVIVALVQAGFKWESAVAATTQQNPQLLEHSGLLSVQLQDPTKPPPALPNGGAPQGPNGNLPQGKTPQQLTKETIELFDLLARSGGGN